MRTSQFRNWIHFTDAVALRIDCSKEIVSFSSSQPRTTIKFLFGKLHAHKVTRKDSDFKNWKFELCSRSTNTFIHRLIKNQIRYKTDVNNTPLRIASRTSSEKKHGSKIEAGRLLELFYIDK